MNYWEVIHGLVVPKDLDGELECLPIMEGLQNLVIRQKESDTIFGVLSDGGFKIVSRENRSKTLFFSQNQKSRTPIILNANLQRTFHMSFGYFRLLLKHDRKSYVVSIGYGYLKGR